MSKIYRNTLFSFLFILVASLGSGLGVQYSDAGSNKEDPSIVTSSASEQESTSPPTEAEATTNISSDVVNKQSVETPIEETSNITNITSAGLLFLTKLCSALANPCLGTNGDDNMTGDNGVNLIYGLDGNDIVSGKGANDEMYGGLGNDNMNGGADNDMMKGNEGADIMNGGDGNDRMNGEFPNAMVGGPDIMKGSAGNDTMFGDFGNDIMNGGVGNDLMWGWDGDNDIEGGDGNDLVVGWAGNDNLNGGVGDDIIFGYGGSDTITGGEGNDKIYHNNDTLPLDPDGSKDTIDCGPGNDEVWINTAVDHDVAVNCEIVHSAYDYDQDGVINTKDNCPFEYNPDQIDIDVDGIGDVCDPGLFTPTISDGGGVLTR